MEQAIKFRFVSVLLFMCNKKMEFGLVYTTAANEVRRHIVRVQKLMIYIAITIAASDR